jgi:hypothetical protein
MRKQRSPDLRWTCDRGRGEGNGLLRGEEGSVRGREGQVVSFTQAQAETRPYALGGESK